MCLTIRRQTLARVGTVDKSQREAVERLGQILIPKDTKTAENTSTEKWVQSVS